MRIQSTKVTIYRILVLCFGVVLFSGCCGGGSGGVLGGTSWRVGEVSSVDSLVCVDVSSAPVLVFTSNSTFSARSLCNVLSGSYLLSGGDGISFCVESVASGLCDDDIMDSIFVELLLSAYFFDCSGDALVLRGEGGDVLVRFSEFSQ